MSRGDEGDAKKIGKVIIVVGGNYGSESKGAVVGHLALERDVEFAVRTGAINAGHTVYYEGNPYKMQLIPVAWVNPKTQLVIGAGAYVHPEILAKEVELVNEAMGGDVRERLFIDFRAGLHTDSHHNMERDDKLHERMGSTGEGCMEACIDKMRRDFTYERFGESEHAAGYKIVDTVRMLNEAYDEGKQIILEGTQGTMLDFHLGHYPYVTSRQTSASAWLTEAGLSPNVRTEIVMVVRTHPIRVAGNSGPFSKEISWPTLARRINLRLDEEGKPPIVKEEALREFEDALGQAQKDLGIPEGPLESLTPRERKENAEALSRVHKVALDSLPEETVKELKNLFELTTVTRKLRRVADLDMEELKYAVMLNRPHYIALTFLNYVFPQLAGVETLDWTIAGEYIEEIQQAVGVPVGYVNTRPDKLIKIY